MKEAIKYFNTNELNNIGNFILNNKIVFIVLNMLSIEVIGYISYLASCKICSRKEAKEK